jgi:leucyl aminopeptidase
VLIPASGSTPACPLSLVTEAGLAAWLECQSPAAAAETTQDPLWPMPLWSNYDDQLSSRIADLNNVSSDGFAGSIIGALFLKRFVTTSTRWLHADIYG